MSLIYFFWKKKSQACGGGFLGLCALAWFLGHASGVILLGPGALGFFFVK